MLLLFFPDKSFAHPKDRLFECHTAMCYLSSLDPRKEMKRLQKLKIKRICTLSALGVIYFFPLILLIGGATTLGVMGHRYAQVDAYIRKNVKNGKKSVTLEYEKMVSQYCDKNSTSGLVGGGDSKNTSKGGGDSNNIAIDFCLVAQKAQKKNAAKIRNAYNAEFRERLNLRW